MAVRSGFVARSMLRNFGPLSVSFGFGGLDGELIFPPEDPLAGLQEGVGTDVLLQAFSPGPPKTSIFYPERESDTFFERLPVEATVLRGPRTSLFFPEQDDESSYARSPVSVVVMRSPVFSLSYPEGEEPVIYHRAPVAVVTTRAPTGTTEPSKKPRAPRVTRAPVKTTKPRGPKTRVIKPKKG
jgi:hypothetical protein